MTAALKRSVRGILGLRPVQTILRAQALRRDPVTVLCYHTLGPDEVGPDAWTVLRAADFRAHVAFLVRVYEVVSLDAVLADGPNRKGKHRPRMVLTFDDGERGLFSHLLPLLDDLRLPVTVYVATAQIDDGRPYWFDRIMGALGTGPHEVDLPGVGQWHLPAAPGPDRWAVLGDILETLKRVDRVRREVLADRILADSPVGPGRPALAPLTRDELSALAESPWVTIGAHSHCHNLLDELPPAEAAASMARSRQLLRDWTGHEVAHFAWPNGNHTRGLRQCAADLGFRTATALGGGLWQVGSHPFAIPRVPVGRHDDTARLALRLVGI